MQALLANCKYGVFFDRSFKGAQLKTISFPHNFMRITPSVVLIITQANQRYTIGGCTIEVVPTINNVLLAHISVHNAPSGKVTHLLQSYDVYPRTYTYIMHTFNVTSRDHDVISDH